jgi:hypothetical protein
LQVLSDRRHILTKDADGNVARVDVLAGCETGRYGKVSTCRAIYVAACLLRAGNLHKYAWYPCMMRLAFMYECTCLVVAHTPPPFLVVQASLDEVERDLFEAHHCPSWFTADNRLGQLSITLEPPDCFNAEEYATVRESKEAKSIVSISPT